MIDYSRKNKNKVFTHSSNFYDPIETLKLFIVTYNGRTKVMPIFLFEKANRARSFSFNPWIALYESST